MCDVNIFAGNKFVADQTSSGNPVTPPTSLPRPISTFLKSTQVSASLRGDCRDQIHRSFEEPPCKPHPILLVKTCFCVEYRQANMFLHNHLLSFNSISEGQYEMSQWEHPSGSGAGLALPHHRSVFILFPCGCCCCCPWSRSLFTPPSLSPPPVLLFAPPVLFAPRSLFTLPPAAWLPATEAASFSGLKVQHYLKELEPQAFFWHKLADSDKSPAWAPLQQVG